VIFITNAPNSRNSKHCYSEIFLVYDKRPGVSNFIGASCEDLLAHLILMFLLRKELLPASAICYSLHMHNFSISVILGTIKEANIFSRECYSV
jgi:hypothetical protein